MKNKKQSCVRKISALLIAVILLVTSIVVLPELGVEAATAQSDILEKYSSGKDIATQIYPERQATNMTFRGTEFKKDSYNLTFTAKYAENPSVTYEGLRFIVASAQEVVKGRKVNIHLNVRGGTLYIFSRPTNGSAEDMLYSGSNVIKGKKGEDVQYAIRYSEGKIWLFENEKVILDGFNIAGNDITTTRERFCNVEPYVELTNEQCKEVWYSNLRLWGEGVEYHGAFPTMPEGNGDYAPTMGITPLQGAKTEWNKGELKNTAVCTDVVKFKRLPFGEKDTYVCSFDMMVEEANESWKGVRPIIRGDKTLSENYQLVFTSGSVILYYNNPDKGISAQGIVSASYKRTLGQVDHVGLVVAPDSVSLWINGVMVLYNVKLEHQLPANIGIKYEITKATLSNFSFYYKDKTPFEVPDGDPVIPILTKDMYNAAQYMEVTGTKGRISYMNYEIKQTADNTNLRYNFSNIPVKEDGEYVFRAQVTQRSEWVESWRGPRFKYRAGDKGDYYLYFMKSTLLLTNVSAEDAYYPMNIEVGRTYDLAIKSDATHVTVWIDGKVVYDNIALSKTGERTKASTGIWFEACEADVTNIQIYGKDVIFTEETFDTQLRNDKWFNMTTVPNMPEGAINHFENVKFGSKTDMDILPSYEDGVFTNMFSDLNTTVYFVDQEDSNNLNGLRNSDTYVWSSKVKAKSFNASYKNEKGEEVKDVGIGFIFKNTTHPGGSGTNSLGLYLLNNRVEIQGYSNGNKSLTYTNKEFCLKEGQEYQVDMLIGKGWIKVWIDNQLAFSTWDLPTYNLSFQLKIVNSAMEVKDIKVYTVEDSDAEIHAVKTEASAQKAGDTLKGIEGFSFKTARDNWKLLVGIDLILLAVVGWGIYAYYKRRKRG